MSDQIYDRPGLKVNVSEIVRGVWSLLTAADKELFAAGAAQKDWMTSIEKQFRGKMHEISGTSEDSVLAPYIGMPWALAPMNREDVVTSVMDLVHKELVQLARACAPTSP